MTKTEAKTSKTAKTPAAPKKAPAAAKPEAAGRRSQYAGKRIYALVKENPRKAGAAGWHSMELIMKAGEKGIAYEDYAAAPVAGGNHLRWDLDRKHIEIK